MSDSAPLSTAAAVRALVLSAFAFSLMGLGVKLAGQRLPSSELVFFRALVALVLCAVMLRRAGLDPRGRHRALLLLRGLFGFGALSCFFYALTRLPLAEATVIQYTNPIFTALVASRLLGERASPRVFLATFLGLAGVVVITRPAALASARAVALEPLAILVGLLGAVLTAVAYVLVRRLARAGEHELVIILYFPLVAVPASVPAMVPEMLWPTPGEWLLLLGVGAAAQTAQVYLTRGIKHLPAARATVVLYAQVVFATLWGIVLLGERPDLWTAAGSLLVLAGTVVAARRERLPA